MGLVLKKVKIAHIQLLPIMSGVQKVMVDFLKRLDKQKFDITVICQGEGDLTEKLKVANISYRVLPEMRRKINFYYDLLTFIKLTFMLSRLRINIIHTHSSKPGFLGRFAAKLAGVNLIVHTVHGFAFHDFSSRAKRSFYGFLERIVGVVSDRVIFLNSSDFNYALKNRILPLKKMIKISNGVCVSEFSKRNDIALKKKVFNIDVEQFVVGSVGRLWEQKDPATFINAIPYVLRQFPECYFFVVGNGPLEKEMKDLVRDLKIEHNVKFLGWRKDVGEILQILDVFVQTSLWEGLSLSILEAMASAKPVVATNIKGNNELILEGNGGFLVTPGDSEMLAKRIITLLKNPDLVKRFGRFNRERVLKNFNIEITVKKIEEIYQQYKFN